MGASAPQLSSDDRQLLRDSVRGVLDIDGDQALTIVEIMIIKTRG